jgi:type II secretory pathway component GspD/PulD (secretin)
MPRFLNVLLAAAALWCAAAAAQQSVLEVIDLKYRNAQEVLPILQPFVSKDGSISALNNQLIVRTSPQNLAELRKILDGIDKRPRRLVITVSQDVDLSAKKSGASVSGTIGNDNASVTLPRKPGGGGQGASVSGGGAEARVYNSQSAGAERGGQTVQVLEGNTAFIRVGQSVPITSRQRVGPVVTESTQFRDATSGFYARPRTNGNQVTIEITGNRDQFTNPATGAANIQRFDTVVSGRLGEWIELGGSTQSREFDENGVTYRSSQARRDERRLYLKVEELP